MSLSINIKQYREDNYISQEYMAERLSMCQPNYSRIEKSDRACAKRLSQLAIALNVTPEVLLSYHLVQDENGEMEAADWIKMLLAEKEEMIQQQTEHIQLLKHHVDYLQAVWKQYSTGNLPMSLPVPN